MPGKQMAIDADLAAGLVTQADAQRRRERIVHEADMYGAMDGASKFLRGDAVASVLIVFINILGGLYVGVVQYGWDLGATVSLFTRLTIGDGLVTQIPAFMVSVAAALIVTRSTARSNLGEEVVSQLISRPVVLAITAVLLGALALTSLPKVPLLTLGAGCITLALVLSRRRQSQTQTGPEALAEGRPAQAAAAAQNQDVEHLLGVDPMRIELGYALVRLVDPQQGGDLLERVAALRRQMAMEMGFVVPPVRIRDNLGLDARGYVITVRGSKVASGRIYPNQFLAVAGDKTAGQMLGREATEPAFGTPAVWISPSQREQAERMNYTVVDPAGVVATHLAEIIRRHAQELLSRERVVLLLNNLRATAGNLVDEVMARLKVGQVQKVLRDLLGERVPIRDLEAILEALCQAADATSDPELMYEHVRGQLARTLSQQYADQDGKLWCVSLDWPLEEAIQNHLSLAERPVATAASIPPELGRKVAVAITLAVAALRQHGRQPVVLCSSEVRPAVRQLIAPSMPEAAVLAYNEVESVEVHSIVSVGIEL
jgi:flagellar biosynthesis protein FlhA